MAVHSKHPKHIPTSGQHLSYGGAPDTTGKGHTEKAARHRKRRHDGYSHAKAGSGLGKLTQARVNQIKDYLAARNAGGQAPWNKVSRHGRSPESDVGTKVYGKQRFGPYTIHPKAKRAAHRSVNRG